MNDSILKIPRNQVRSRNKIEQHEHEDDADARRVLLVDELGDFINSGNRLPVDAIINIVPGTGTDKATVYNIAVAIAGVELSQLLPIGTTQVKLRIREKLVARIQYTFTSGQSGTNFFTVMPGNREEISNLSFGGNTIYFQTNRAGVTVEMIAFHT